MAHYMLAETLADARSWIDTHPEDAERTAITPHQAFSPAPGVESVRETDAFRALIASGHGRSRAADCMRKTLSRLQARATA